MLVIVAVLRYCSWVGLLTDFLPPVACVALSSTIKASSQGRGFQVKFSLNFEFYVHSVQCLQQ